MVFNSDDRVVLTDQTFFPDHVGKLATVVRFYDRDYDGNWYLVLVDGEEVPRVMIEWELDPLEDIYPPVHNT